MPTLLIPSVFSPKWDPFLWHQESQRDGRFVSMLGIVVVPFPTSASTVERQDSTTWHALLKTHYTTESWSSLLKLSSVRHSTMDFVVHPEKESQSARDEEKKNRRDRLFCLSIIPIIGFWWISRTVGEFTIKYGHFWRIFNWSFLRFFQPKLGFGLPQFYR